MADLFQLPGALFGPAGARDQRLQLAQDLAQLFRPVDRDQRRALGQIGQMLVDALDDRLLDLVVDRQQRDDLFGPLDGRQGVEFGLAGQQLLAAVGDRQGVPDALIALGQQPAFQLDAFQPHGLHVEQVVVVPQPGQAQPTEHRHGQA